MQKKESEQIFICLGTNLGNRVGNLKKACEEIGKIGEIKKMSFLYETEPVDYKDQPLFLNQVIEIQTMLSPYDLLRKCLEIETKLGRIRTVKNGPRIIDIDLLLYGKRNIQTQDLIVPHPRMFERAFVLVPLADIAPEFLDMIAKSR